MARDYIIEEVRAIAWTMRLRNPVNGEIVEVPMTPGARFSPPAAAKNGGANGHEAATPASETSTSAASESPAAAEPTPEVHADADNDDGGKKEEAPRRRKRRKGRASKTTEAHRGTATEEAPAPSAASTDTLETPEGRRALVDESTLTVNDRAAWEKLRGLHRKGTRAGKRGDLGWEETTEEGRSGIFARWGKGQFKILHAGNDTYALFYEWDGGKWERLACGGAEDLMKLAAARADEEIPGPPLTTLNLEHARLLCGTPAQPAAAKERPEPVYQRSERPERREARNARARTTAREASEAAAPAVQPTETPAVPTTGTPAPPPADETTAMDRELMSSFTTELEKVLGEEDT